MSPWARLMMRITPNMSESPHASSAYTPPRNTPCTTALTQVMPPHLPRPPAQAEVRLGNLLAARPARPAPRARPGPRACRSRRDRRRPARASRSCSTRRTVVPSTTMRSDSYTASTAIGAEAERHLVEEQQTRVAHQRPADGGRLLLAAGEVAGPPLAAAARAAGTPRARESTFQRPARRWRRPSAGSPRPSGRGTAAAPRARARCRVRTRRWAGTRVMSRAVEARPCRRRRHGRRRWCAAASSCRRRWRRPGRPSRPRRA